jgi:hypothetical protein
MLFALALSSSFFGLKFRTFAFALSRSHAAQFFALFFCAPQFFALLNFSRSSIFCALFCALFCAPRYFAHVHLGFLIFALIISCSCDRTARTGQAEQDSQNRTARTGQPEQDSQNMTARTGQPEQDSQNRTARTGQQERDRQNKTAWTG